MAGNSNNGSDDSAIKAPVPGPSQTVAGRWASRSSKMNGAHAFIPPGHVVGPDGQLIPEEELGEALQLQQG